MILELIAGGFVVGDYIYHRLTEEDPPKPKDRITIPYPVEGTPVPLIYGRCRVNAPLIAWYGNLTAAQRLDNPVGVYSYDVDVTFVLGIPFSDGTVLLHNIFLDDHPLPVGIFLGGVAPNVGGVPYFASNSVEAGADSPQYTSMPSIELGGGSSTQTMTGSTTASSMILSGIDATLIPSFRGFATIHFAGLHRNATNLPALAFELASYAQFPIAAGIDDDENPANVIYDLFTGTDKLGIPVSRMDYDSFRAAALALVAEGHGYSRAIEDVGSAAEVIDSICRQIDAVYYEDPEDSTIHLKLIRGDYDPQDCQEIDPSNCRSIENPAAGGWTGRTNKLRVMFLNRELDYHDDSATAQANAADDDPSDELVMQMPGITTMATAEDVAGRELAARSRPMFKCTAIVDRSFLRRFPGDVVALTWPDWNISGMLMRIGGVTRGTLESGEIKLDLIQDFFYSRRGHLIDGGLLGTLGSFPTEVLG